MVIYFPRPCFQFRASSGEALSPAAMKAAMRRLGGALQRVLAAHDVRNITQCGAARAHHSPAQAALLALAALLLLAALLAALALCLMHSSGSHIHFLTLLPPPILLRDSKEMYNLFYTPFPPYISSNVIGNV